MPASSPADSMTRRFRPGANFAIHPAPLLSVLLAICQQVVRQPRVLFDGDEQVDDLAHRIKNDKGGRRKNEIKDGPGRPNAITPPTSFERETLLPKTATKKNHATPATT